MKKVMLLTSAYTGNGHKSVSDAILQNMPNFSQDIDFKCVEVFELGTERDTKLSKIYNITATKSPKTWDALWNISDNLYKVLTPIISIKMRKKFLDIIQEYKPDFILSVHPLFVGGVVNILEDEEIDIPFGTCITDIASIHNQWVDPRVDVYFCTTDETKAKCISQAVPTQKIIMVKYPLKKEYRQLSLANKNHYNHNKQLKVILLSGGDGIMDFYGISKIFLDNFDAHVTIITGHNQKAKDELELSLGKEYKDKVDIKGFTTNLSELYLEHHLAIVRASPAVIFEAVQCNIPMLIVSFMPGQEALNPFFAQENGFGINCVENYDLKEVVADLLNNDGEKLIEIEHTQIDFLKKDKKPFLEQAIAEYMDTL